MVSISGLTCLVCSSFCTHTCDSLVMMMCCLSDTGGEVEYRPLVEGFLKATDAVIVGFGVDSRKSFEEVDEFLELAQRYSEVVVVVGNKRDIYDAREVDEQEARNHFENKNPPIRYYETSAKTGENVKTVIEYVVREWFVRGNPKKVNQTSSKHKCIIS